MKAPPPSCRACGGDGRRWDAEQDKFLDEECPRCGGSTYEPIGPQMHTLVIQGIAHGATIQRRDGTIFVHFTSGAMLELPASGPTAELAALVQRGCDGADRGPDVAAAYLSLLSHPFVTVRGG